MAGHVYPYKGRVIDKEIIKIVYILDGLELEDSLRVTVSDSHDITIMGRLIRKESTIRSDIEVVADIFNDNHEMLLSLQSYNTFNFKDNPIESFKLFCADTKRFFGERIAAIEVYTRVKRSVEDQK